MNATDLLANVRVASPCPARWTDMTGDDRARFCAQCRKHVYNLSEMTAEAAAGLIREKEGNVCVRFHQRADGTVLTADCPVGAAAAWRLLRRFAAAAAAMIFAGMAANVLARGRPQDEARSPRPKVYEAWDDAILTVKGWFGARPQPMVMGAMCPPVQNTPPPTPTVTPILSNSNK